MTPRAAASLWAVFVISACLPLNDLDSYRIGHSAPSASSGGSEMGGASSNLGGEGGAGGGRDAGLCGDGIVDQGEACDDGGLSERCTSDCRPNECPEECECALVEGSYYAFCSARQSFAGSRQACERYGMSFEVPASAGEHEFLVAWAARLGHTQSWIGGTDSVEEGQWISGGETLFWEGGTEGDSVPGVYANWRSNQPDDLNASQHCSVLELAGGWDDAVCDLRYPFVCVTRPPRRDGCGNAELEEGEICDDDGPSSACDADCTAPFCGDGLTNRDAGEECDDGNKVDLDACDNECKQTGLVAHWPLSERVGWRAYDVASFTHHGDAEGPAAFSSDGSGYDFDGVERAILIPNEREPKVDGLITMMARAEFYPPVPTDSGFRVILMRANDEGLETWLRFAGTGLEGGSWFAGSLAFSNADVTPLWETGTMHHLATRFDGSEWTLWVDGEIIDRRSYTQGALEMNGTWHIGGRPIAPGGWYFAGKVRDVRLYDRPVPDEIIEALASE